MTIAKGPAIADAIVEDCNLNTWSEPCEFSRVYIPRTSLEDTSKIYAAVQYAGQRCNPDSRAAWLHEYDIDIGVQRQVNVDDNATLDQLTDLLDEISDYWKTHTPGSTGARMTACEWLFPFVPEHLTANKQFTGVLRLTFRLVRATS